jgi:hypothetical protein
MNGSGLALAIRRENPAQRIAMITGERSPTVRRSVQRELGDIPLLGAEELLGAIKNSGTWGRGPRERSCSRRRAE